MEGLKTAQFLGHNREFYYGMPALEYIEEKGVYGAFQKIGSGSIAATDFKSIVHFVYAGLTGGCEYRDQAPDFTYSDVYAAVEELLMDGDAQGLLPACAQAFAESNTVKYLTKKVKAKPSKKK